MGESGARRAFLSKRGRYIHTGCRQCSEKDYSEPCPLGWVELADGICSAPLDYKGDCSKQQGFMGGSAVEKEEVELMCGVCWPCKDDAACVRDWSRPCPFGYAPSVIRYDDFATAAGTSCEADLTYDGQCEAQISFQSDEDKRSFAQRCKVAWPCKAVCGTNAQSTCPEDWTHAGDGYCVAPAHYKVPTCRLLQNFRGWTSNMKLEFAQQCH